MSYMSYVPYPYYWTTAPQHQQLHQVPVQVPNPSTCEGGVEGWSYGNGHEPVICAVAYVWVESRLANCLPVKGEVAGIQVQFVRSDPHNDFILASIVGTSSQLVSALTFYNERCGRTLLAASGSGNSTAGSESKGDENDEDALQRTTGDTATNVPFNENKNNVLEEIGPPCSPCTPSPNRPVPRYFGAFRRKRKEPEQIICNVLVNLPTYWLLTSYDGTPLKQLEWLTGATFGIALCTVMRNVPTKLNTHDKERARVCIRGGRHEVDCASIVLKEIMIFIGNRFSKTYLPKNNAHPSKVGTVECERGQKSPCPSKTPPTMDSEDTDPSEATTTCDLDENEEGAISTSSSSCTSEDSHTIDNDQIRTLQESPQKPVEALAASPTLTDDGQSEECDAPTLEVLLVDEAETGKIIGFKGENIRRIESESQAFVQMAKLDLSFPERKVRAIFIVGSISAVKRATEAVLKCVTFSVQIASDLK